MLILYFFQSSLSFERFLSSELFDDVSSQCCVLDSFKWAFWLTMWELRSMRKSSLSSTDNAAISVWFLSIVRGCEMTKAVDMMSMAFFCFYIPHIKSDHGIALEAIIKRFIYVLGGTKSIDGRKCQHLKNITPYIDDKRKLPFINAIFW